MITIREIIALTALNFGLSPNELVADNRQQRPMLARHVAMFLARKHTPHSTITIGRAFNRDHSTVLHALERMESELKDAKLKALVEAMGREFDLREKLEALGGVDVLAVATRVARRPSREAIGVSVMETAALAATVLDLWEIARTADALVDALCTAPADAAGATDRDRLMTALASSIRDEMATLRGETTEETEDGSSHS